MSRFEQALEQVRRAHREDLDELSDDLHEALELQARFRYFDFVSNRTTHELTRFVIRASEHSYDAF